MTGGPRAYGPGVERALYRLARGTCYFPDCPHQVIEVVDGEPIVAVQIAHIYGAKPGSARYDPLMSDVQRRAFGNLVLLCVAHHKTVDGRRRDDFPADLLQGWKRENEPPEGIEALASAGLTDEFLAALMEQIVTKVGLNREVEVDLEPGLMMSSADAVVMGTMAGMATILESNPHLTQPKLLMTNVRNTGTLSVSVEAVDLHVVIGEAEENVATFTLMGRNDFGDLNPRLPHRLADGDAMRWLTQMETISGCVRDTRAAGMSVLGIRADIRLATGEKIQSELMAWVDMA